MAMTWIWTGMVVVSILCGLATGNGPAVAAAAMEGSSAVRLQCRYTLQEGKLTPYLSYATVKEG